MGELSWQCECTRHSGNIYGMYLTNILTYACAGTVYVFRIIKPINSIYILCINTFEENNIASSSKWSFSRNTPLQ